VKDGIDILDPGTLRKTNIFLQCLDGLVYLLKIFCPDFRLVNRKQWFLVFVIYSIVSIVFRQFNVPSFAYTIDVSQDGRFGTDG
jgi:hypothetical protein